MVRKILAGLLVVCLLHVSCLEAMAQATPSDAEPDRYRVSDHSDSFNLDDYGDIGLNLTWENYAGPVDDGSGVMPLDLELSPGTYKGTWGYGVIATNDNGVSYHTFVPVYNSSTRLYECHLPSGYKAAWVELDLYKAVLPSVGTYRYINQVNSGNIAWTGTVIGVEYAQQFAQNNVNIAGGNEVLVPTSQVTHNSNFLHIDGALKMNPSVYSIYFKYNLDWHNYTYTAIDMEAPFMAFYFGSTITSGVVGSVNANVSAPSSEDIQESISDAVSQVPGALTQMSGQLDNIGNTLQEIVTTISNQLNALWNQMYNLMHIPHMAKLDECTTKIVDAINDIYIDFSSFSQQIIANDNKLYADKEAADQQRQDQLVNGYDTSDIDSENAKLQNSLEGYEQAESEILTDVKTNIENFTYNSPFDAFILPMRDISSFLTVIYDNIGDFKIPIQFSLTLTIALMCIGWYRFRGA